MAKPVEMVFVPVSEPDLQLVHIGPIALIIIHYASRSLATSCQTLMLHVKAFLFFKFNI